MRSFCKKVERLQICGVFKIELPVGNWLRCDLLPVVGLLNDFSGVLRSC